MAGPVSDGWLEGQIAGAPAALVERTRHYLSLARDMTPEGLAQAARAALRAAIAQSNDRRGALDLLAADALVTLSLAAQVERDPAGLERFALSLLAAETAAL